MDEALALLALPEQERQQRLSTMRQEDPDKARRLGELIEALSAATTTGEPSSLAEALGAPERIARYRILSTLGEGGMGTVFLARQDQPDREVALKLIRTSETDREVLARFRVEAEALAQLEHPGIARIYEAGTAQVGARELPWLAMEYVRGPDLLTYTSEQALDRNARLQLLIGLARAVHHAHGRGVIHRDLKPQNILVDPLGQPKVLDFGVARIQGADSAMTRVGQVVGTLGYMSPEQLSGNAAQADARSDVYALGVIAYQLLSGQLPYPDLARRSLIEALDHVRRSDPAPLGSVDPALGGDLETVVMKALAGDPAQRYESAAAFAADIERVLEHRPVDARPPTPTYLLGRFARRHRVLVSAAALVLVSLLASVLVSLNYAISESVARAEAEARAAEASAVSDFVSTMLTSADPEQSLGRDIRVSEVLAAAAADLEADTSLPGPVRARILGLLGGVYFQLGDYPTALNLLRQAEPLAVDDRGLGDEIGLLQADSLAMSGESQQAQALLQRLLAQNPAPDPELALQMRSGLIRADFEQGRLQEAEAAYRLLLDEAMQHYGAGNNATLTIAHNFTSVLQQQARFAEALELNAMVVEQRSELLGADHPQTLFARNLRAILLFRLGQVDEAEAEFRTVLEARRRTLGDSHPSSWTTEQSLAALLIGRGEVEEGAERMAEVLAFMDSRFGPAHTLSMTARDNLAQALESLGRKAEAEAMFRELLSLPEALGDSPRPELLVARNNLAMLLLEDGRQSKALEQFDRLLAQTSAVFGDEHPYTAIFRGNRGQCLAELGRRQEAIAEFEASLAVLRSRFGPEHARTLKVEGQLQALQQGSVSR